MSNCGMTLAAAIVRHRRWIVGAWVVVVAVLAPFARLVTTRLEVAARVQGSASEKVERELAARFHSPFAHYAVLVITGIPAPNEPPGETVLREIVAGVHRVPGVTASFSYLDVADTVFLGSHGTGTYVLVGIDPGDGAVDALVPPLRSATSALAARLRERYPAAALRWTGEIALNHDLRTTSADDGARAERRVLPMTLVLLFVAFGTITAALLPLIAGGLAIVLTLGAAVLVAAVWPLSILLQNIVSMIGLGLGIDYALLTVSRFREAMAEGATPEAAATEAAHHAGRTIAVSGASVAIGFVALLFVPLNELWSIGVGGVMVVAFSVLIATTLLPGILVSIGGRVNARRRTGRRRERSDHAWRRWAAYLTSHPILVLVVAGAPLLMLGWQARRLNTELPRGNWLPPRMESARALEDLRAMGRSGITNVIRVMITLPDSATVFDPDGRRALIRASAKLLADPRVARVRSLPVVLSALPMGAARVANLPVEVRRSLISDDSRVALVEVLPRESVAFNDLSEFVRELRGRGPLWLTDVPGAGMLIGGMPAFNADYSDVISGRFATILALIVLGTLVVLSFAFRSVLIPLKAIVLNLVSVAAAFGAVVLVFQDGHAVRLLGLEGAIDGVFPAVPIVVFCIIFGLSMDYEVFLVARVAEARRSGLSGGDAIAEGLARTGGIITSAAAIMIVVFAGFTFGDFVMIKILGFALAIAVLVDATLVRLAIGPALLQLAGRWNWWPGERSAPETASNGFPQPVVRL
jgi:putative drug exporter of the RND superfamily